MKFLSATRAAGGLAAILLLSGCSDGPWNNPHPPNPDGELVYQTMMSPAPPKPSPDPVIAAAVHDWARAWSEQRIDDYLAVEGNREHLARQLPYIEQRLGEKKFDAVLTGMLADGREAELVELEGQLPVAGAVESSASGHRRRAWSSQSISHAAKTVNVGGMPRSHARKADSLVMSSGGGGSSGMTVRHRPTGVVRPGG